jgi:hypothetical protein
MEPKQFHAMAFHIPEKALIVNVLDEKRGTA